MINGIHHISLRCEAGAEYEKTLQFYCDILGLTVDRQWDGGIMLDTGDGIVEIFTNAKDHPGQGALRHVAFRADGPDDLVEKVRNAGYPVTVEPRDIDLVGLKARIAFVVGPLGEEIELFHVY